MAKKSKKSVKLPDVLIDSVNYYKVKSGIACEGIIGTHIIHRVAGNERAALNKVQRTFNKM